MKNSFVYRWTNTINGKIYIGKHKGAIDDGYIGSGKSFITSYNANPNNFVREIVFEGSEQECLDLESQLIIEHIENFGHKTMYNLTHWNYLKQHTRKCLHCGRIVDPNNLEWSAEFEKNHFNNCRKNPKSPYYSGDSNIKVDSPKKKKKPYRYKGISIEESLEIIYARKHQKAP